jgi:Flp pilus assembly protein TadD
VVVVRFPLVIGACLVGLAGCSTAPPFGEGVASPDAPAPAASGAAPFAAPQQEAAASATAPGLLGSDSSDHLSLGKKQYRAANYALAEQHFRKAVEARPKDGEAWVGLAAAYDRLKRFDLADRAYREAIQILGPTPEILNNQGFSYMLRGDYARARRILREAQAHDPRNPYILNNLNLLAQSVRKGKAIE